MPSTAEEDPGQETRRTACYGYQPKKALLQVLPVIVHGKDGKQTEVLAMLDSGCDCTLISSWDLCQTKKILRKLLLLE
jgi:hypothetical protein